jgi:hypothetical protein
MAWALASLGPNKALAIIHNNHGKHNIQGKRTGGNDRDSPCFMAISIPFSLTRIIHERFCCKRGYAVPTGVLATQSVNILFQVCLPPSWLRLPVSQRVCAFSRRTVMNNAG